MSRGEVRTVGIPDRNVSARGLVRAPWLNVGMQTFAITYVYSEDTAALDEHRPAHRAYLSALAASGSLLASGPVRQEDMTGALIIVQAPHAGAAIALLEGDPFWQQGLVLDRAVVEWNIVIGAWAETE
ncbi:YCII-related [Jonesia denitrificans DSM 20603]|uniref:YCII-related n=2 Tax=Jonesia TaxID=43673 RepID=C7R449_JONDD|nr:YCII-related [Jonesia denitrificans DSM 20603]SQH20955.1 YciI-like protein [Jonesia denitrificans]